MPQISKVPLPREVEKRIRTAFKESLTRISSGSEMEKYIFDLFTPTEQVMFAKRLAIAALLTKNFPYKEISDKLRVSTATVARINLWLRSSGSGYRRAVEKSGDWKVLL